MSKQYDNTNTGAIFTNDRKTEAIQQGDADAEKWADRTGSLNVGGREYWVNGWLKKTKDGRPFLSLSVKPKDGGPERQSAPKKTAAEEMDDSIPF